jgi:hypothetical protein
LPERLPERQARAEWLCGYAAALAALVRLHDRPSLAKDILACDGISIEQLRRAGVPSFDLTVLERACQ